MFEERHQLPQLPQPLVLRDLHAPRLGLPAIQVALGNVVFMGQVDNRAAVRDELRPRELAIDPA